jgi:hypothetical protein
MTTTADLRELTVTALQSKTGAGTNIYSPRTWSTWSGDYPVVLVRAPEEEGQSFGRNGPPAFTVTSTIHVSARIHVPGTTSDQAAAAAESILEEYREQIKAAVINYPALMSQLQQYPFFRSQISISAEGERPIGEVIVQIGMEFVQGPEDFYPVPASPLEEVSARIQMPDGTTVPGADIEIPQT